MTGLWFVLVALYSAWAVLLTLSESWPGQFQPELIVGAIVLGWPVLVTAPLYFLLFAKVERSRDYGSRTWLYPLLGMVMVPIPVLVVVAASVIQDGEFGRIGQALLKKSMLYSVYGFYCVFGAILGTLVAARVKSRRRQPPP